MDQTTEAHHANESSYDPHAGTEYVYVIMCVGSSISTVLILFTLITFLSNRYLRVKRPHILSINLCISLLMFYIGYVISLSNTFINLSDHSGGQNTGITPLCKTGAVLLVIGWFFILSWILAHWAYLCFIFQQSAPRHISNFFVKACMLTYVPGFVPSLIIAAINASSSDSYISREHCWYQLDSVIGIAFTASTIIMFFAIVICSAFCISKMLFFRNSVTIPITLKKNRNNLVRLSVLSLTVLLTQIPHLAQWVVRRQADHVVEEYIWVEVLDGIMIGIQGVLIVICLLYRRNKFYSYWSSVILGRNPTQVESIRLSRLSSSQTLKGGRRSTAEGAYESPGCERKIEPRDSDIALFTDDDEVFLSSNKVGNQRVANAVSTNEQEPFLANGREKLNSFKHKVIRASFRKTDKPNVTSAVNTRPESSVSKDISNLNRFNFRQSILLDGDDRERKTSF